MAVPVAGKVLLDTNGFVDYLRAGLHTGLVFGRIGNIIRFLSSVVLMELRLGADTPRRKRAVERITDAFPKGRLIAPASQLFDHAGRLFRTLDGDGSGIADRLGPRDDLLSHRPRDRSGQRLLPAICMNSVGSPTICQALR